MRLKQLQLNNQIYNRNLSKRTGLFFLSMILFYLFMGMVILPSIPENIRTENVSIIAGQMILFIPMITYVLITKGEVLKTVPHKKTDGINVLLLIIMTYTLMPFISLINAFSMLFAENKVVTAMEEASSNPLIINLILMALVPAIIEELIFRGIIYSGYMRCGKIKAIVVSALIFGLFHMNVNQLMYAFAMGMIFAIIRDATGSIYSTMIMHFVFNANSVVMLKLRQLLPRLLDRFSGKAISENDVKKIKEQLENSKNITSLSSINKKEIVPLFIYMIYSAVIGLVISYVIFIAMKKRKEASSEAVRDAKVKDDQNIAGYKYTKIHEIYETQGNDNTDVERVITIPTILGIVICIGGMVYISL